MGHVTLEGVTKVFRGGTVAIDNVSLAVPDGSFFVFLGPSGCGKTTLLRLVAGLEKPTEGKILIAGKDVTDLSPRDRDVAMVFQSYALYPHLTAFENMAFGLRSRRMDKKEVKRRVEGAAFLLGLEPVLHKRPRHLSGGQRQRVALGRAIVREPHVFLMDEPLSDVDTRLRDQMRGEIARLQNTLGVTTLYVTHDQSEAMTLGDRVAVMEDGIVRQVGTAKDLYDHPADLFVATFLGTPPMNAVETVIEGEAGDAAVRLGAYRLPLDGAVEGELVPGRKVVFGIRPEHIRPARPGDDRERLITLSPDRYELVGSQGLLRFQLDASPLMLGDPRTDVAARGDLWTSERPSTFLARVEADHHLVPDVGVDLFVDVTRAHLFDAETELAIR
jgi:multiple sugar transport system ATP-binding protein